MYILGLDPIERLTEELEKYVPVLTRHPLVNLLQTRTAAQEVLRAKDANTLEYYITARKEIEKIIGPTGLRPVSWDNYRSPWVTKYARSKVG